MQISTVAKKLGIRNRGPGCNSAANPDHWRKRMIKRRAIRRHKKSQGGRNRRSLPGHG